MKPSKKAAKALSDRQKAFTGKGPNQQNKHQAHMPGSQNRKKGFSAK